MRSGPPSCPPRSSGLAPTYRVWSKTVMPSAASTLPHPFSRASDHRPCALHAQGRDLDSPGCSRPPWNHSPGCTDPPWTHLDAPVPRGITLQAALTRPEPSASPDGSLFLGQPPLPVVQREGLIHSDGPVSFTQRKLRSVAIDQGSYRHPACKLRFLLQE